MHGRKSQSKRHLGELGLDDGIILKGGFTNMA